eukprot:jgi/Tetstr1/453982/TSEL_040901.t1
MEPVPPVALLALEDPTDAELATVAGLIAPSGAAAADAYLAAVAGGRRFADRLLELAVGAMAAPAYADFYRSLRESTHPAAGPPVDESWCLMTTHWGGARGAMLRRVREVAARRLWAVDLDGLLDAHETEAEVLCELALEASAPPGPGARAAEVRALCRAMVGDPRVVVTVTYIMAGLCEQYRAVARLLTLRDRGFMSDDEVARGDDAYAQALRKCGAARLDWLRDHEAYRAWLRERGRAEAEGHSPVSPGSPIDNGPIENDEWRDVWVCM